MTNETRNSNRVFPGMARTISGDPVTVKKKETRLSRSPSASKTEAGVGVGADPRERHQGMTDYGRDGLASGPSLIDDTESWPRLGSVNMTR